MSKINKGFIAAAVFTVLAGLFICVPRDKNTAVFENGAAASPAACSAPAGTEKPEEGIDTGKEEKPEDQAEKIVVYVCGAVKNPGVYELAEGARAGEAIDMAGGFSGKAALFYINQAQKLSDGEKLYIPLKKELENGLSDGGSPEEPKKDAERKININTAGLEELMEIPGVGQVRAEAVLSYREQNGRFRNTEDIMKIDGIKEGSYHKMKDYITVSDAE